MYEHLGEFRNGKPPMAPRSVAEFYIDDPYVHFHEVFNTLTPQERTDVVICALAQSQEILAILYGSSSNTQVEYIPYDGDMAVHERFIQSSTIRELFIQKQKNIVSEKIMFSASTIPLIDLGAFSEEKTRETVNPRTVLLPDPELLQDHQDEFAWMMSGHEQLQKIAEEYDLRLRNQLKL